MFHFTFMFLMVYVSLHCRYTPWPRLAPSSQIKKKRIAPKTIPHSNSVQEDNAGDPKTDDSNIFSFNGFRWYICFPMMILCHSDLPLSIFFCSSPAKGGGPNKTNFNTTSDARRLSIQQNMSDNFAHGCLRKVVTRVRGRGGYHVLIVCQASNFYFALCYVV